MGTKNVVQLMTKKHLSHLLYLWYKTCTAMFLSLVRIRIMLEYSKNREDN